MSGRSGHDKALPQRGVSPRLRLVRDLVTSEYEWLSVVFADAFGVAGFVQSGDGQQASCYPSSDSR